MRVGLVYDIFAEFPWRDVDPPDADAEFEPEETVEILEEALVRLGHTPVRVGSAYDLLYRINASYPEGFLAAKTGLRRRGAEILGCDSVINIAEGVYGRNREAYTPVLLDMLGVPYLGSDALTLSLTLDKAWTKNLATNWGISTPPFVVFSDVSDVIEERIPRPYPLFAKPRYEGSSKGITASSKITSFDQLKAQVDRINRQYEQDVLVERFIEGGGEFTVAVMGNEPPTAMPVLQRAVEKETRIGLHALDRRGHEQPGLEYMLEGALTPALEAELGRISVTLFEKLQCHDFARLDFRVDAQGVPWFLEINPLPTFAPDGTFAILAELMGLSYVDFLAETLQKGFERLGMGAM